MCEKKEIFNMSPRKKYMIIKKVLFSLIFLSLSLFSLKMKLEKIYPVFRQKIEIKMEYVVGSLHYFVDIENKSQNVRSNIAMQARSKKRKQERKLQFSNCTNPADRETRSKL